MQERRQVDLGGEQLELGGVDARQIQDVVDEGQQMPTGLIDDLESSRLPLGQGFVALQDLREAQDAVERRAQFVTHRGQEGALGSIGHDGGVLGAFRVGEHCLQVGDGLRQPLRHRVDARGEDTDLVLRLHHCACRQIAGGHPSRHVGQALYRPDDVAAEYERHRDAEYDRHHAADQGLRARAGEAVPCSRQLALELGLLARSHLREQADHALGLRCDLGAVQVQVLVGTHAIEDADNLQRRFRDLGAIAGDGIEPGALFGGEEQAPGGKRIPDRCVGRQLRAVGELEVELARGGVGHQVGGHGIERGLEDEQIGHLPAVARRGLACLLHADHDVDLVEDPHAQRLQLDPGDAQRGSILQRVIVQIEQLLRQLGPALVGLRQLGDPLRFVDLGPAAGHGL